MKKEPEVDLPEIVEVLTKWTVHMAIGTTMLKMISDAYERNPRLFWSYQRHKHENLIFNCRM